MFFILTSKLLTQTLKLFQGKYEMPVLTCVIAKLQLLCKILGGGSTSSVLSPLLEVEQIPEILPLACSEMSLHM